MNTLHDLVHVEWDDACTLNDGWKLDSEVIDPEPQIVHTVGFLYRRTKDHLVVCSTFDAVGSTVHHFQIPKKMVRSMTVLIAKGSDLCPQG